MTIERHDLWDYRWPEDALRIAIECEETIDQLRTRLGDLTIIARGHYASSAGASFSDANHDLGHALAHVETARRTIARIYDRMKEGGSDALPSGADLPADRDPAGG